MFTKDFLILAMAAWSSSSSAAGPRTAEVAVGVTIVKSMAKGAAVPAVDTQVSGAFQTPCHCGFQGYSVTGFLEKFGHCVTQSGVRTCSALSIGSKRHGHLARCAGPIVRPLVRCSADGQTECKAQPCWEFC